MLYFHLQSPHFSCGYFQCMSPMDSINCFATSTTRFCTCRENCSPQSYTPCNLNTLLQETETHARFNIIDLFYVQYCSLFVSLSTASMILSRRFN